MTEFDEFIERENINEKFGDEGVSISRKAWEEQQRKLDEKDKLIALATSKWCSLVSIIHTMDMVIVPDEFHEKLDELGDTLKGV